MDLNINVGLFKILQYYSNIKDYKQIANKILLVLRQNYNKLKKRYKCKQIKKILKNIKKGFKENPLNIKNI